MDRNESYVSEFASASHIAPNFASGPMAQPIVADVRGEQLPPEPGRVTHLTRLDLNPRRRVV